MEWLAKEDLLAIVRNQLARDMNCRPEDFCAEGILFCPAALREGRRMFKRQTPFLEIATMGRGVVVSADADILSAVRSVLQNRTREDIFAAPFVWGHSLYYLPDTKTIRKLPCPAGFTLHFKTGGEIHALYTQPGFENAIQYDENVLRPDVVALCAMQAEKIVAVAGASADCKTMWQIGIDVLPAFRDRGLASCLVNNLTPWILERGVLPYYGTASSNIPSQIVAYRSGYLPAWMCTYKNVFDASSPYEGILRCGKRLIRT